MIGYPNAVGGLNGDGESADMGRGSRDGQRSRGIASRIEVGGMKVGHKPKVLKVHPVTLSGVGGQVEGGGNRRCGNDRIPRGVDLNRAGHAGEAGG